MRFGENHNLQKVGCRIESNCQLVGSGNIRGEHSVGGLSKFAQGCSIEEIIVCLFFKLSILVCKHHIYGLLYMKEKKKKKCNCWANEGPTSFSKGQTCVSKLNEG